MLEEMAKPNGRKYRVAPDWVVCTACRKLHNEEHPGAQCTAETIPDFRAHAKLFFNLLENGHSSLNKHLKNNERHRQALRAWKGR